MAIGTTAAILGSAVLGAGASILGNKAQSKAAGQAADASAAAAQAQLQLGRESLALNQNIYNSKYDLLSPFVSRGNVAGDSINALLGLPSAPKMSSPVAAAAANAGPSDEWASQALANIMPHIGPKRTAQAATITDPSDRLAYLQGVFHPDEAQMFNSWVGSHPIPAPAAPAAPAPTSGGVANNANAQQSARKAFDQFAKSAGMDFQLDLAHDAINNGYAGNGALQSGAAMKEISDRSQQMGLNNYFMPYMGLLSGQQSVGAQSGAAVAGVGANFGNTAAGINNGMGQAIGNNAANIGNLALANGQNKANMFAGLGSSFGQALGAFK